MANQKTIRLQKPTAHIPAKAQEEQALPIEMANHPFVYVHYPHGWEFDRELGFLPSLCELHAKPGCNGVGEDGKLNKPMAGAIQKGGTIIDPADKRLDEWQHYVGVFPTRGGLKHFTFIRAGFTVLPGGKVIAEDHSDDLRRFRAHLRDSGIIDPMEQVVFDMLLEVEQRGLQRLQRLVVEGRRLPEEVDAKRARISAMQRAWSVSQGEVPPDEVEIPPTEIERVGRKRRIKLTAAPATADVMAAQQSNPGAP